MNTQTDPGPKTDAAIQVRVSGNDVQSKHFDELSTAIPTPKGALLETIHELCEGTTLEITQPFTHHKAIAQVKSLGPKLGVSTLVFVEGLGVGNLWHKESPKEGERGRSDVTNSDTSSGEAIHSGTLVPLSERRLLPASTLRIPPVDRLMESLTDLVESALEQNLRPTVERLTNEIPEHVVKVRSSVFANFEAQIETAFATCGARLDGRALEVIARNEQVLNQKVREVMEETLRHLQSQQEEFRQNLEGESLSVRERLNNEAATVVSQGCAQLRDSMQTEAGSLEKQVAERCQALTEETQNVLCGRAQQVEADLADRLSQQINQFLAGFSAEFEKRVDQALALPMAAIDKRLEETAKALSDRAQQVERDFAERLDQQADGIARRFRAQLQESFEQKLIDQQAQFQEQLAANASQFRARFLEQMEDELNEKKEKIVQEAQRLVKDVRDQNQNRLARSLREWAQAMENQAEPASETVGD